MSRDGQSARRIVRLTGAGLLLALGVAYLVAGVYRNLISVGPGLANRAGTRVGDDFSFFYAGAREVAAGNAAAVYSEESLRDAHSAALGVEAPPYQWTYPPTAGLVLVPLASLPPLPAYWAWVVATLLATAAALGGVVRDGAALLSILPFPGVPHAMICNQTALLNMAIMATGLALLASRPAWAGAVLALLTYKPQAALLVPVALLGGGCIRGLMAWTGAALGLIVASVLAFGTRPWVLFVQASRITAAHVSHGRLPLFRMPTPFAALLLDGASPATALAVQAVVAVLSALAVLFVWRRCDRLSIRALALTAATPLATPYAYDYDLAWLAIPFVLLLHERRQGAPVAGWVLATLWLAPVLVPLVSQTSGWHVGPLLLAALLAHALRHVDNRT